MKCRTGFVSNSSSCSFIISIPLTVEKMCNVMEWYTYELVGYIKKVYEEKLESAKNYPYKIYSEDETRNIENIIKWCKLQLSDDLIETDDKIQLEEALTKYFECVGIEYSITEKQIDLEYHLSMFNGWYDLPRPLIELITALTFEGVHIKCRKEDNH